MTKIAIITGASRGIGKAAVQKYQQQNWKVINISRNPCLLEQVENISADFSTAKWQETIKKKLTANLQEATQISLIHNACHYLSGSVETTDVNELEGVLAVNILAPVFLNQVVLPYMKSGSSIVYIGSTLSEMGLKNCMPYVLSKHAMLGLMRSTCQDLGYKKIHTCCICPGFTETELLHEHLKAGNRNIQEIKDKMLMNRLIQPDEVADFIYYCSNQPIVNGGVFHTALGVITN